MSNEIQDLVKRLLWTADNDEKPFDAETARLAAKAIEDLDAQLDACIAEDINKTRENEIFLSALTKWGAGMQTVMVFEEMAELQKELCKSLRGKDNRGYIAEEIADVRIMLDQMEILHHCAEDVDVWRRVKLARLEKRLREAGEGE